MNKELSQKNNTMNFSDKLDDLIKKYPDLIGPKAKKDTVDWGQISLDALRRATKDMDKKTA